MNACPWCKAKPVKTTGVTEHNNNPQHATTDKLNLDKRCIACGKEWYETYILESWDLLVSE